MKLKNPTDKKLEVQLKGVKLSIDADSVSEDFSTEEGSFFKEIYQFLEEAEEVVKEAKEVEEVEENVEDKGDAKKVVKKKVTNK